MNTGSLARRGGFGVAGRAVEHPAGAEFRLLGLVAFGHRVPRCRVRGAVRVVDEPRIRRAVRDPDRHVMDPGDGTVGHPCSAHTVLRAQLYMETAGVNFDVDGTTLMAGGAQISPPTAPTAVKATAGADSAIVSWTPPAQTGGGPLVGYTVSTQPGSETVSVGAAVTHATVPGLANGASFSFTVAAASSAGQGPPSLSSNVIVPSASISRISGEPPRPSPTSPSREVCPTIASSGQCTERRVSRHATRSSFPRRMFYPSS